MSVTAITLVQGKVSRTICGAGRPHSYPLHVWVELAHWQGMLKTACALIPFLEWLHHSTRPNLVIANQALEH